jgi:general secretion pathway protein L
MVDHDRIELSAPPADTVVTLDVATQGPLGRPDELDTLLSSLSGPPQRIRLKLAPSTYLLRQLTLPRAARADLAEAVRYQLPQLTPFSADRVLYACGEATDSPGDGGLDVWLVVIPRRQVERALELIGQSPPQNPVPLKRPPTEDEPLELSWRVTEASAASLGRRRLAWLGMIALWLAIPIVHLNQLQGEQAALDRTLATLRGGGAEVSELRDRLEAARVQTAWLGDRKQATVSVLAVMDHLSELLDDQTWLQGLDLQGDRLKLRGISSSPAGVVETLEASGLLEDLRFDAAITRDGRGQGDRFNISARIAPAARDGSS